MVNRGLNRDSVTGALDFKYHAVKLCCNCVFGVKTFAIYNFIQNVDVTVSLLLYGKSVNH